MLGQARLLLALWPVCALGCDQPETVELQVVTWWQSTSEGEAFKLLRNRFSSARQHVVFDEHVGSDKDARRRVAQQLMNRAAPDSFQANLGLGILRWTNVRLANMPAGSSECLLEDVSDLVSEDTFPEDLVANLRGSDGQLYGVPINIHRTNLLYYRVDACTKECLTLDKFCYTDQEPIDPQRNCPCWRDQLRFALDLGTPAMVNQFVFENLLPGVGGADLYNNLFEWPGQPRREPVDRQQLREDLKKVLECVRDLKNRVTIVDTTVPGSDQEAGWRRALRAVAANDADFTVTGDWATAERKYVFTELGIDPRTEPVISAPFPTRNEEGEIFVFTSDVFPVPVTAPHRDEAREFLRVLLSEKVQTEFNKLKGSIPALKRIASNSFTGTRLLATSGVTGPQFDCDPAEHFVTLLTQNDPCDEHLGAALDCLLSDSRR